MSYCQFENTASAFADCLRAIRNRDELSESELSYAEQLRDLAEKFVDAFDEFKEELDAESIASIDDCLKHIIEEE